MTKGDDKDKRVLRDTTKPEHRPSWGVSGDNASKGAAAINWGDRGVPVPTPSGTGNRTKRGLFSEKVVLKSPSPRPKGKEEATADRKLTGMFSEKARETRQDQADKALMGGSDARNQSSNRTQDSSARIQLDKPDRKPVFRKHTRDDDHGR